MVDTTERRHHGTNSRSRSTKYHTSRRHRHNTDGETTRESTTPDIDELRRRREAYYSDKSKHIVAVRRVRSSIGSARVRSEHGIVRRSTQRQSNRHSREIEGEKHRTKPRDRTAEYVYCGQTIGAYDDANERKRRRSRDVRSQHTGNTQSTQSSSPELPDQEVTPDDSISQVGTRKTNRNAFKRTTLRAIPEGSTARSLPQRSDTRSKKGTSFWGSLLGRQASTSTGPPKVLECLTCGSDDVLASKAVKLSCGHQMCNSCLRRIFKLAVHDPAHMPPKCCTSDPIPLKLVGPLFDLRFKLLFNKKLDEYNTKNRIYCPNRRCGVWIRPSAFVTSGGRKVASCSRCSTKACIHCGQKLHKSRDCPEDPEIARLVEQAERQGWKRCYSCNAIVELKEGCNHMTCRCLAEFCMVCGSKWKTCDCPWFNHSNMPDLDRLNDMVLPQPIEVMVRRVRLAYQNGVQPPAEEVAVPRQRLRGYREELDDRRRQELEDEELARRMQFATFD